MKDYIQEVGVGLVKKIDNKNWDEDRVSHKESVRKFGEHSILYNAGARKGAKSNPFKKKPKKK